MKGAPRRLAALVAVGVGVLLLAGCSSETQDEWSRFAMPDPASEQGERILHLWQGAWIAALVTGVIVWGLIFYAIIRFRRRSADEIPVQTRYNLPLEIFYTIAPVIMVIVFFTHTVKTQNYVLDENRPDDNCMEITGQQWTWTFNYGVGEKGDCEVTPNSTTFPYSSYVIHDFGVPAFLMKMDVIPGRVNHYAITPTTTGTFRGKCYELCGTYHSRMLFNVHVVTREEYDAHLKELAA